MIVSITTYVAVHDGWRVTMTTLGHERATIVGQSFGGGVAMTMAYLFPELCERLVLVGSGGLGVEVNPLLRALRVDKLTLAALGATLSLYLQADGLLDIPLYAMLHASPDALRTRARALCDRLSSPYVRVCDTHSATGGGTLPLTRIPSAGVAVDVDGMPALQVAQRLREQRPPLVGRIEDRTVIINDRHGAVVIACHRHTPVRLRRSVSLFPIGAFCWYALIHLNCFKVRAQSGA